MKRLKREKFSSSIVLVLDYLIIPWNRDLLELVEDQIFDHFSEFSKILIISVDQKEFFKYYNLLWTEILEQIDFLTYKEGYVSRSYILLKNILEIYES